jgi:hypothetical protein
MEYPQKNKNKEYPFASNQLALQLDADKCKQAISFDCYRHPSLYLARSVAIQSNCAKHSTVPSINSTEVLCCSYSLTSRYLVYNALPYNKIQTLQSLNTNLLIIFLFCNINLTWLNLYSNVVPNNYTFKKINIKEISGQSIVWKTVSHRLATYKRERSFRVPEQSIAPPTTWLRIADAQLVGSWPAIREHVHVNHNPGNEAAHGQVQ